MEESVRHLYYISPNMRKTLLASCRSQFLLDRLGKCLKLFVSTVGTSCHKFASQYGLEIFLYDKLGPKTTPNTGCCAAARQRIVCRSRSTDRQRQRAFSRLVISLSPAFSNHIVFDDFRNFCVSRFWNNFSFIHFNVPGADSAVTYKGVGCDHS